jgi:methylenetetrahydrofolate reductase (NADPH)
MSVTSEPLAALLRAGHRSVSFEFFPPKDDEGEEILWRSINDLEPLQPTFVSVTYGAGGTSQDRTVRVTSRIVEETSLRAVGHLTLVGQSAAEIEGVLKQYAAAGVDHVLALRGDPKGGPRAPWEPSRRAWSMRLSWSRWHVIWAGSASASPPSPKATRTHRRWIATPKSS